MAPKTGFDRFLEEKLRDPRFRQDYELASAEIDATDALIRALDGARTGLGISKSELARRMAVKPEIVRRLLTDLGANPTLRTVLQVATALDHHLELVPNRGSRHAPGTRAARRASVANAARSAARAPGTRRRAAGRERSRER